MCGIAGALLLDRPQADEAVERMCNQMRMRGPDAAGHWSDPGGHCVLGHRRLSIIDLDPRSGQPMLSRDGRFVIVFNGEIYNYRDLKRELSSQGVTFRTEGDTEVMLELFARAGIGAIERLRGMFAFALWDRKCRTLYLARDPYGIKPLYFAESDAGVLFASQVKALIGSGAISRTLDPAGLASFFLWGSVSEPWTIYETVRAVPAGSIVIIRDLRAQKISFYADIRKAWSRPADNEDVHRLAATVRSSILDSVRCHLVADVPVSVFLSGGLDSSVIAGLIAELGHPVEGVTIGFEEFAGTRADEVPPARQVAQALGIPHTVRMVGRHEFEQDLGSILDAMDQPSIDGVNTWFAAKAAAERGYKVVLSGVGGDELFAGYGSFQTVPYLARVAGIVGANPALRHPFDVLVRIAAARLGKPKLAAMAPIGATPDGAYFLSRALFLPQDLPKLMGRADAEEGLRRLGPGYGLGDGVEDMRARGWPAHIAALESSRYLRNQLLRDADWASMAHSLELRTPLVDYVLGTTLAPFASAFVKGMGKRLLAGSVGNALPGDIIRRRKTGFGLPMQKWLTSVGVEVPGASLGSTDEPWSRRWSRTVAAQFGARTVH